MLVFAYLVPNVGVAKSGSSCPFRCINLYHKYMYVRHFCLKQSAAIEIDKDTIATKYAELLGSRAEGEVPVCHAFWYNKDVAVKLFTGSLTIRYKEEAEKVQ